MSIMTQEDAARLSDFLFANMASQTPYLTLSKRSKITFSPLAMGILSVLDGKIEQGGKLFLSLFEHPQYANDARINFMYLVSQGYIPELREEAIYRLSNLPNTIHNVKARCALSLATGTISESDVFNDYIKPYVLPNLRHRRREPLVFYHIPKCAGTSVNQCLAEFFYGGDHNDLMPGYIHADLAEYCLNTFPQYFPYMSTKHMDVSRFPVGSHTKSFTLFRDPSMRLHSMYSQSIESACSGYNLRILPKYNSHWRYWDSFELAKWLATIPQALKLGQISTFSPEHVIAEAKETVMKLTYKEIFNGDAGNLLQWLNTEGVFVKTLPRGLNASHRKQLTAEQIACLTHESRAEWQFLKSMTL